MPEIRMPTDRTIPNIGDRITIPRHCDTPPGGEWIVVSRRWELFVPGTTPIRTEWHVVLEVASAQSAGKGDE